MKVRRYKLAPRKVIIFLKTQDFRSVGLEVAFNRRTALPNEILAAITPAFDRLFNRTLQYRATGVVLSDLEEDTVVQLELFGGTLKTINAKRMFETVDALRERYGKHTLFLGFAFHGELLKLGFEVHCG
jgi:DNA polymerase-4/DNA polymerase V